MHSEVADQFVCAERTVAEPDLLEPLGTGYRELDSTDLAWIASIPPTAGTLPGTSVAFEQFMSNKQAKPGSEIHRDAQRDAGPQYHGKEWKKAETEPAPGMVRDEDATRHGGVTENGGTHPDTERKRDGGDGEQAEKS